MKKYSLLLFFLILVIPLFAQIYEPVHWAITHKLENDTTAKIIFKAEIDEGWHLYGLQLRQDGPKPTKIVFEKIENAKRIGELQALSKLEKQYDPNFDMELTWYNEEAIFIQKIGFSHSQNVKVNGYIEYMACNDKTCLQPTTEPFSISLQPKVLSASVASVNHVQQPPETDFWTPVIDELKKFGESGQTSEKNSLWFIFLAGLIGGLLAILTPCIWPIIPMTVSFFLKRSENRKLARRDAFLYGLSIIVIYVALGLLVTVIFGASALNSIATNAVFNIIFFVIFFIFALSFFGAFELTLPSSWSTKLDAKAQTTAGWLSILFMAFTLVIVSFSCTGPIIGTLLVEVSSNQSILAPTIGMFGFALALSVPFTLFAFFPSWLKSLPRSGGWLNQVKVVLAFIELAFALKFLSVADLAYGWHILDREVFLSLWIVIFTLLGIYLLGKIRFPHDSEVKHVSVLAVLLAILSLSFSIYMIPGLWGAPLKAISAFAPPLSTQDFNLYRQEVHPDFTDYDQGMMYAKEKGLPVIVDFSGYGCVNCRKMEASVLSDPAINEVLKKQFVLITLYVDDKTPLQKPYEVIENGKVRKIKTVGDKWSYLQRYKFGANAQPFFVMLNNDGKPLNKPFTFDDHPQHFLKWLTKK